MSENITWLNEVHEASHDLFEVSVKLKELSEAFYRTGNTVVSNKLSRIADDIYSARKQTSDAIGKMLSDQVQAGFDQLGSVFLSALDSVKGNVDGMD